MARYSPQVIKSRKEIKSFTVNAPLEKVAIANKTIRNRKSAIRDRIFVGARIALPSIKFAAIVALISVSAIALS